MNKKYLQIVLLCSLVITITSGCAKEDSSSLDPSEIFVKYYGTDATEVAIDLVETNTGYLILGERITGGSSDYYLIATDSAGNEEWNQEYKNDSNEKITIGESSNDVATSIRLYDNGQKAVIVGTSTFKRDGEEQDTDHILLVSIDLAGQGSVIDSTTYRYFDTRENPDTPVADSIGFISSQGADILFYSDGTTDSFIVLGSAKITSEDADPTNTAYSIMLMKVSTDFSTLIWSKLYGFSQDDFGRKLVENNGAYYFMGKVFSDKSGTNSFDAGIYHFDPDDNGAIEKQAVFGTTSDEDPNDFISTNGGLVVSGTTGIGASQFAYIQRVDYNLEQNDPEYDFSRVRYGPEVSALNTTGNAVIETFTGSFYVTGAVNNFSDGGTSKGNEIFLAPVDGLGFSDGTNAQAYGGVGNDIGAAVLEKSDGSLVIAATVDFGGDVTMISLLKTNKSGKFKKN